MMRYTLDDINFVNGGYTFTFHIFHYNVVHSKIKIKKAKEEL